MFRENLMCVWEAVWAEDSDESTEPSTDLVQEVTAKLKYLHHVNYDPEVFKETFTGSVTNFDAYKKYVGDFLKVKGTPMYMVTTEMEDACWEMCKRTYPLRAVSCQEFSVRKLWQIFLTLAEPGSYPPTMKHANVIWLLDKLTTAMQKFAISTPKDKLYTFKHFLVTLEENYFKFANDTDIEETVEDIHDWLVKEVCMSGWLYKRTHNLANWTNWQKKWFILYPGRLEFFDSPSGKDKKGEVFITSVTKLEASKGRKSVLRGRSFVYGFRITNRPYLQMDMCAPNNNEREAWMAAIKEVIDTSKLGPLLSSNLVAPSCHPILSPHPVCPILSSPPVTSP